MAEWWDDPEYDQVTAGDPLLTETPDYQNKVAVYAQADQRRQQEWAADYPNRVQKAFDQAGVDYQSQQDSEVAFGLSRNSFDYIADRIPFYRSVKGYVRATQAPRPPSEEVLKRFEAGKASEDELRDLAAYYKKAEIEQADEDAKSIKRRIGDVVSTLPAYAIEFALTGGAANRVGTAVGTRVGTAVGSKVLGAAAGGAAAVGTQTALNPLAVAEKTAQYATQAPKGQEDYLAALGKGTLDVAISTAAERSGAGVKYIPGAQKAAAFKQAMLQRFLKIKPNGKPAEFVQYAMRVMGQHGPAAEMGEERFEDILRSATGLQSWEDAVPTKQQLMVEAIAFSVPGAVGITAQKLLTNADARRHVFETVPQFSEKVQALPENPTRNDFLNAGLVDTANTDLRKELASKLKQDAVTYDEEWKREVEETSVPADVQPLNDFSAIAETQPPTQAVEPPTQEAPIEPGSLVKFRDIDHEPGKVEAVQDGMVTVEGIQQPIPAADLQVVSPEAGGGTAPAQDVQPTSPVEPAPAAKTNMDLILDQVERSGKEMTVQLEGATPDILKRAIQAANDRGLRASTDGRHLLIRPPAPAAAPEVSTIVENPPPSQIGDIGLSEQAQRREQNLNPPVDYPELARSLKSAGYAPLAGFREIQKRPEFQQAPISEEDWMGVWNAKKPKALPKSGITTKRTPKGWSVTGLPEEIADGLKLDYQGKRTSTGYFFKLDPTEGLIDAERTIRAQAERDAAESAKGRVKTSAGYLPREEAEAFNQERAERLKEAKQQIAERNANLDDFLSGAGVSKKYRGQFKLELMRARDKSDFSTVTRFDEVVQFARDYPQYGMPSDESELGELLIREAFTQDDAELLKQIDAELIAEIEADVEEGDASFDFGANVKAKPTVGGAQMGLFDAEAQGTLFNTAKPGKFVNTVPGLGKSELERIDEEQKQQQKEKKSLKGQTKLQEAADKATQEAFDELDLFGKMLRKKGLGMNAPLDPEVIAGAARVVARFVKAGTFTFASLIEQFTASIGKSAVENVRSALESEWDKLHASGEFPGMEPRSPEAVAEEEIAMPGGDDLTSIKKAVVNDMRKMVGLPEMEGSTPQTVEEWAEGARATLANDPLAAVRLVNELATNSRPISQHDAMLLQFRYRQLANELKPLVDEYFQAVESEDPVKIATARTGVLNARKAMTDFEEIIHPSKETWGRTGVALQQMMRKDFSLEAILRRGQEHNMGEELSPDQTAELTKFAKQLEELQTRFDELRKKHDALEADLASKNQHQEVLQQAKQRKVVRKSERRQAAEKKVSDAWAEFKRAITGRLGSAAPVDLLGPAVKVAKAYVELGYVRFGEFMASVRKNMKDADETLFKQAWDQVAPKTEPIDVTDRAALSREARRIQRTLVEDGITEREKVIDAVHESLKEEFPEITRRQAMDALSRYGQFQTQSQDEIETILRGMNAEILKLSQIDQLEIAMRRAEVLRGQGKTDEEIGKALADENLLVEATGLVRDKPSQTVRQLTQKYNELKKSIPSTPEGREGLLQTSISQIVRALENRIADLTWEIENKQKIVREKRERPTSDRIQALEAERDSLRKIHEEMFPKQKKTMSDAQRLAAALRGADKAIEHLEKQLKNRDFDTKKTAPMSSPALEAKRARLKQLRAAREAAKSFELQQFEGEGGATPKGKIPLTPEQRARRVYEASLRKRIADYQQTLVEGDFAPKPKKEPRTLSDSELKLKREMEDIRHKVLEKYAEYHLAHLNGFEWTLDKIMETAHLSRALMTSFDLSALLRQGGLPAMAHPILAKRALTETIASIAHTFDSDKAKALRNGVTLENVKTFLKTIDSRQAEFDFMHKITEGKAGEFRLRSGLNLPNSDEAITRQEEAFQGRWAKHVPGVAVSSRLYTMILNKMRADLFDLMVENIGRNGKVTLDEAKLIANFVNVSTGRSNLGVFNRHAATLNTVFFAPRYVASRFQYLAMPFYLPFTKGSWRVKREIYKEIGRAYTGVATVLGAIALSAALFYDDDDEDKPTLLWRWKDRHSSDYLKPKIGDTRFDFLAGLQQVLVLSSRIAPEILGGGKTRSTTTGELRKFGEGHNPETRLSTILRFGRTKLAPVPGAVTTGLNDWTNVVGQKETPTSLAVGAVTPLSLKDVAAVMESHGVPKGTAMSLLSILGVGMSTYGPKTQYMTGTPEQREEQIANDLKNMKWNSPERPPYSEFLTDEQLKKFRDRLQEKKRQLVKDAAYVPQRWKFKSQEAFDKAVQKRNAAQENLRQMREAEAKTGS